MWRVTTWDKIILLLLFRLHEAHSSCQANGKWTESRDVSLPEQFIVAAAEKYLSEFSVMSFLPQLTVAQEISGFGCVRCCCCIDIGQAMYIHIAPLHVKIPAVVLCTFSPWNQSLTRRATFFLSSFLALRSVILTENCQLEHLKLPVKASRQINCPQD